MKKIITAALISVAAVSLAACGAKDDAATDTTAPAAEVEATTTTTTQSYTKADFMKACEASMTEAQCGCFVDFYGSIGLKVTDLGDQAKVQAAVTSLKPEQSMKMAECMQ